MVGRVALSDLFATFPQVGAGVDLSSQICATGGGRPRNAIEMKNVGHVCSTAHRPLEIWRVEKIYLEEFGLGKKSQKI